MQKTITHVEYIFCENQFYFSSYECENLRNSCMIFMSPSCFDVLSDDTKISFDKLLSYIENKSLVIFMNSEFNSEYQHRLIITNKNIYFGALPYYYKYDHNRVTDFNKYVPDNITKFVIFHAGEIGHSSCTNLDFRESICLQNIYHCTVDILSYHKQLDHYSSRHIIRDIDKCYKYDFKLPYGCTVEVIDDFNKLVS